MEEVGRMIGYDSITPVAPLTPARVPPANPEREFHTSRARDGRRRKGSPRSTITRSSARSMARALRLRSGRACPGRQSDRRRSEPAAAAACCPESGRTSATTRAISIISGSSKSASEIHQERETPHLRCGDLRQRRRRRRTVGVEASGRMPASGHSRFVPRSGLSTNIRSAPPMSLSERLRSGPPFEFHPQPGRSRPRRGAGSRSRPASKTTASAGALPAAAPIPGQRLRSFGGRAEPRALIGDVELNLAVQAPAWCCSIAFLRDFTLPDGQRSLSYRLTVGAPDRTLSSEEVSAIRTRIIEGMRARYELKV